MRLNSQIAEMQIDPRNDPRNIGANIPSTESVPELPKEIRRDADKIAKWTTENVRNSRLNREYLERYWIRVMAFMEGFHYGEFNTMGAWIPKGPKPGEVRGAVPLMRSIYRRELGRFTDNILSVQAFPKSPNNPMAFYKSERAELMINAWQEETNFEETFAEFSQDLIYFGLTALYRYVDPRRKQVLSESWCAWDVHPVPWNATKDADLQGFQRVRLMPKDWIEENIGVEAAAMAGRYSTMGPRVGGAQFGNRVGASWNSTNCEAGEVIWTWLLPSPQIPSGQFYICVGNEMFGYRATDPQGNPITDSLAEHKLPVQFTRYTRQKDNWYGMGLLPTVLGAQAEADRNWSKTLRRGRFSNGMLIYRSDYLDADDAENADRDILPMEGGAYGVDEEYVRVIPPVADSPEFGGAVGMAQEMGRAAAGHESDILFGKAEGRVESGPLGRILNVNAQAPLSPTFRNIYRTLRDHYSDVLDLISRVWPDDKRVSTVGRYNLPNEQTITRENRPTSDDVILRPSPLVPAGRAEMYNLLLALRQMISDDKKPEISSAEFRRGIAEIGMQPPGLDIVSKEDERVRQRVAELYNDGMQPGPWFNDPMERRLMLLEDPRKLNDALKEMILEPGFRASASRQVKLAFLQALQEVRKLSLSDGAADDRSDENLDLESMDAQKMEQSLDSIEQDPQNMDGMFQHQGMPVGIGMGE